MGTTIYGSHDDLVFELSWWDRVRAGLSVRTLRVKLDDVVQVRSADPADLVTWPGERVLRLGRERDGRRVVVFELIAHVADGGYDRIIAAGDDADDVVAGLHRSGIGGRAFAPA